MSRHFIKTATLLLGSFVLCVQPTFAQDAGSEESLYDRLGGLPAISVVVDDFINAMYEDEEINKNPAVGEARDRIPAAYFKYHLTAMVCQVTGGPCQYHGRPMKPAHYHLNITEAEWDRMVVLFKGTLAKFNVPEKEVGELVEIVGTTKKDIVRAGT